MLESQKSIEGTLASILVQAVTVTLFFKLGKKLDFHNWMCVFYFILFVTGLINFTLTKAIVAVTGVITNSLTEALTDQVDNLVLPLVSFVILSL